MGSSVCHRWETHQSPWPPGFRVTCKHALSPSVSQPQGRTTNRIFLLEQWSEIQLLKYDGDIIICLGWKMRWLKVQHSLIALCPYLAFEDKVISLTNFCLSVWIFSWWVLQTKEVIFFFLFFSPLPFPSFLPLPFHFLSPLSLSFSPLPLSLFLFLRFKVYTCFNMLLNSCITQFASTLIWNHSYPIHYKHNY